jgi:hypothetical protein
MDDSESVDHLPAHLAINVEDLGKKANPRPRYQKAEPGAPAPREPKNENIYFGRGGFFLLPGNCLRGDPIQSLRGV